MSYPILPAGSTIVPAPAELDLIRYTGSGQRDAAYPAVAIATIPTEGGVLVVPLVLKDGVIVRADEAAPAALTWWAVEAETVPSRIRPAAAEARR